MQFSEELSKFTRETPWTFAKTYAETWPHEYLCSKYIDDTDLFYKLVQHIRTYSREGRFYRRPVWYFEEAGYTYWTMARKSGRRHGIIRWRMKKLSLTGAGNNQTYEYRKEHGTLPEDSLKNDKT